MRLIVKALVLAIPMVGQSATIAYSPSIAGQPLIFHFSSMPLSQFSALTWTQIQNALLIQASYANHFEHMTYRPCCGQWNVWVDGMAQWLHQTTDPGEQFGYKELTGGFTLGVDKCYKNFLVGAAFSYTNSSLDWNQAAGNGRINSYYGGLYGNWNNGLFYLNMSALGAFNDYNTTRDIHFRTAVRNAHSQHNGGEALVGAEFGALLNRLFCKVDFVPFVSFDYVYLAQQEYTEENARTSNLRVASRNDQLLQSQGAFKFSRRFLCGHWIVAPNLTLGYINQTPLTSRAYDVTFVKRSRTFSVDGWSFERNLGALAFCLNVLDCQGVSSFALRYDGQYGGSYWAQIGSVTCNFRF